MLDTHNRLHCYCLIEPCNCTRREEIVEYSTVVPRLPLEGKIFRGMLCYGDLATATLFLCVTCFRHVSAFVPTAGLHSSNNRDRNRIHRIQPSTSSGRPQGLLMRGTQLPEEEEERSSSKNRKGGFKRTIDHDNRELTRLDFGRRVGLGFAAGAALLLDAGGSKHALAEDTAPTSAAEGAGDAAAPTVAETAPVASETVVATPTSTSAAGRPGMPPLRDMGIEIPYIGKPVPLNKFLGSKATLVVNPKLDDPESLQQVGVYPVELLLGVTCTLPLSVGVWHNAVTAL